MKPDNFDRRLIWGMVFAPAIATLAGLVYLAGAVYVALGWGGLLAFIAVWGVLAWGGVRGARLYMGRIRPGWQSLQARRDTAEAFEDSLQRAMERVNVDVTNTPYHLSNIGVLAYNREDENGRVHQTAPLPLETRYLRPFAGITGRTPDEVRLEIRDDQGKALFTEVAERQKRLYLPSGWLPFTGKKRPQQRDWSLRVYVDGKLFALYPLRWSQVSRAQVIEEARTDGEIDAVLTHKLAQTHSNDGMSLDELLEAQETADSASV